MGIRAVDPTSKTVFDLGTLEDVTNGIDKGLILLKPDGSQSKVQSIMGGYIIDGMTIPVALGGPWLAGQREILLPLIKAGKIPAPPADVWARGVVPLPGQVAQQTNEWLQAHGQPKLDAGGIPTWLMLAGGGVLLYLMMSGSGGRSSSHGEEI